MLMNYSLPAAPDSAFRLLYCLLASLNSPPTVTQTEALADRCLLLFIMFTHSHSWSDDGSTAGQIK